MRFFVDTKVNLDIFIKISHMLKRCSSLKIV